MSKIKICGLRRLEDAIMVNDGLPDFAGFILTPSRRQVTVAQAMTLSKILSPSIRRIGVFAKETPDEIAETAFVLELDGIQLHLDTTPAFLAELNKQLSLYPLKSLPFLWQRLPVPSFSETGIQAKPEEAAAFSERLASFAELSLFDGLLLDTYHDGQDGGTGQVFPWKSALGFIESKDLQNTNIIVAGGLTADNVADAISVFNPYAVDVSSGVETDGYKDRDKVLRFIETARKA